MELIELEQKRLSRVLDTVERAACDRALSIARHDARTKELEKERLDALGWKEKNGITEKLVDHGHHDPRKYLIEYSQQKSPYFGAIGIKDSAARIGAKEYLIG